MKKCSSGFSLIKETIEEVIEGIVKVWKKIILIGSGGSGKSTLARQLGNKLNIKVHHLDALFWKPNWEGVPREEQIAVQNNLIKDEKWIIDGIIWRWV